MQVFVGKGFIWRFLAHVALGFMVMIRYSTGCFHADSVLNETMKTLFQEGYDYVSKTRS